MMKKITLIFWLILSITSLLGQGKTLYIDPSATVNGDGTKEHPLDGSIFKVKSGQPWKDSTTYLFRRGTVFNQTHGFNLTEQGKSSDITFDAYGEGAKPIIKGKGTDTSGACFNVGGTLILPANIIIKNLEIDNNHANSYLAGCGVAIANRTGFFKVLNCSIHGAFQGVRVTTCPLMSLYVDTCKIYDTWSDGGFFLSDTTKKINSLRKFVAGWDTIYDVNTSMPNYPNDGDGWHIIDADSVWVHHNYIDHSSTGTKFCLIYNQIILKTNAYVLLEHNHYKYNNWSTHTYLTIKKGSTYISRYNWYDSAELAIQSRGYNVQFYYNKFTNCAKIYELDNITNDSIVFHNNVIYHTDTLFWGYGPKINFQNNIVDGVSRYLYNSWQKPSPFFSDYNCYLGIADTGTVTHGPNDIFANPLFTDTATLDFTLKNNSPCINAGTNIFGNGLDYDGKKVPFGPFADIGAYESSTSTPTNLIAIMGACGTGKINLSWNATTGATRYTVYRDGSSIYDGSGLSTIDSGLVAGSKHTYSITASNTAGTSASFTIPAIIYAPSACVIPATPTNFVALTGARGTRKINLSWNASTGATRYTVYRDGSSIYNGSGLSTIDSGLAVGSGHTYSITASNTAGTSASFTIPAIIYVHKYFADNQVVEMPKEFALLQNVPNPFNPSTIIKYQLPNAGTHYSVSLKVYDMLGREVVVLVNGMKEAGYYTATFDASHLSSGMFFARLVAQSDDGKPFAQTIKLLLMK